MRLLLLCAVPLLAQKILVLPPSVELTGPEARQQMIAEASLANHQEDWTRTAEWSSSDPKIATVDEHGLVRPVGDGEAKITARVERDERNGRGPREGFARAVHLEFSQSRHSGDDEDGVQSGRVSRRACRKERIQTVACAATIRMRITTR